MASVGEQRAIASAGGQDERIAAVHRATARHQSGHRHHLFDVIDAEYAVALEHRVIGTVRAGHVRGVRNRCALARCGGAGLQHDDLHASVGRARGDGGEEFGPFEPFDISKDDARAALVNKVTHHLEHIEIGLVACGHDVADAEPGAVAFVIHRNADAAAVRQNADRTFASRIDIVRCFDQRREGRGHPCRRIPEPKRVRAENQHPAVLRERGDAVLDFCAYGAARQPRKNDCGAHLLAGTIAERGQQLLRSNRKDRNVNLIVNRRHVGESREVVNRRIARIDRVDRTPEP